MDMEYPAPSAPVSPCFQFLTAVPLKLFLPSYLFMPFYAFFFFYRFQFRLLSASVSFFPLSVDSFPYLIMSVVLVQGSLFRDGHRYPQS